MTTTIEYALMAGASYRDTRADINKFPIPVGWNLVSRNPQDDVTGFEAATFGNATTIATSTNIVISFAGTDPGDITGDIAADLALAAGVLSDQLRQAADYYLQVKASAPANATISFTGHSLGGGLASLMAVMFGESAFTFDQAPFLNSAETFTTTDFLTGNTVPRSVALDLRSYLAVSATNDMLVKLDAYIAASDPFNSNPLPADTLAARSGQVTNINTQGEFQSSWFLVPSSNRIGSQADIKNSDNVSGMDLHAQALLTAFLQSGDTPTSTASDHTLGQVSFKLTDLLKMVFDPNLFAYTTAKTNTVDPNFLEHLVRHQTGGMDGVQAGGDAMVTRFTSDLWKIAQDGGLTMSEGNWHNVSKALIAFAMQTYYEENNANMTYGAELFTDLGAAGTGSNGIRFDLHDVSKDVAAAMDSTDPNVKVDLAAKQDGKYILKGYEYFQAYLDTTGLLAPEERTLIKSMLPVLRDWYVQAGTGGMVATDTLNRGAFMLGGAGADALSGGTKADLLVGNAGTDVLQGGGGSDVLLGGAGNDTYIYTTGPSAGLDTVLDTGGDGSIVVDGATLAGGDQYGDLHVHRDASGHTYTDVGLGLVIDGNMFVQGWQAGQLGLTMTTTPLADVIPATGNTIIGDSFISDTGVNDHIIAGSGYDHIYANHGGDNFVEAGGGPGYSASNPTGGWSDYVYAGDGNDHLYADSYVGAATAIASGNTVGWDYVEHYGATMWGGAGKDTVIGGTGNDSLYGGTGSDLLIGGSGGDFLECAADIDAGAGSIDDSMGTNQRWDARYSLTHDFALYENPVADLSGDVAYAGEGSDLVVGSHGNDVIFGENGNDGVVGFGGNDVIMGGQGEDLIYGDIDVSWADVVSASGGYSPGNDYLDGGDQGDTLYGGECDDILVGGKDNDQLYGGAGQDTYLYNMGDGVDTVNDTSADRNILRFGAGVDSNNIKLHLGSLMLDLGNGDSVHITGFDQNDVFNSCSISSFEFADGATLSAGELLARGFDLEGNILANTIIGTNTTDRITGNKGNDTLDGGLGSDTYFYNLKGYKYFADYLKQRSVFSKREAVNDTAIHAWRVAA